MKVKLQKKIRITALPQLWANGAKTFMNSYSNFTSLSYWAIHKRRRQLGGVINWSKLPTDSTKKLPTRGRRALKIRKNCQRHLWLVPMFIVHIIFFEFVIPSNDYKYHFRKYLVRLWNYKKLNTYNVPKDISLIAKK